MSENAAGGTCANDNIVKLLHGFISGHLTTAIFAAILLYSKSIKFKDIYLVRLHPAVRRWFGQRFVG